MRGTFGIATLLVACSFNSEAPGAGSLGVGDETGDTATPVMSDDSADDGEEGDAGDPSGPGTMTPGDGTASADGSDTGMDSGPGETTGNDEVYASCKETKEAHPMATNGLFAIAPVGTTLPTPIWVYCDMQTDGGGWTLVGRSVADSQDPTSFGWGAARGDPSDTTQPYSLNVKAAALKFDQILVGNHSGSLAWGGNAYRLDVTSTFMTYEDEGFKVSNVTTVIGDCSPSGGPAMLRNAGHTGASIFFLRDSGNWNNYGLRHDRFDLYDLYSQISPCDHSGRLHEDEGMIMVR